LQPAAIRVENVGQFHAAYCQERRNRNLVADVRD
jgi:hypothetical protein